jgi:chemotaxis protein CheX
MDRFSQEEIVSIIEQASREVFATMLGLPIEPQPAFVETGDPTPVDGIIALVGIGGTWTGAGRIYCSPEFACRLAGGLLGAEYKSVDEEVLDSVSEVANMIIGNVKTGLEERLGPLGLSIPTVIFGKRYLARSSKGHERIVVPFRSGEETMQIRFSLAPASASPRPLAGRPEVALA